MRLTRVFAAVMMTAVLLLIFSVPAVYAGTINVTSNLDDGTGCTLREAISRADAGSDGDGCTGATGGADTIVLPADTYTIGSQFPEINTAITIQGSGSASTFIQANASANVAAYRIFQVGNPGNLIVDGVTVRNGGNDTTFTLDGGCFYVAFGQLTLQNGTIVEGCRTGATNAGGAIYTTTSTTVNITGSTVRNNTSNSGAGIYAFGTSAVNITSSTFSGNTAVADGIGVGRGGAIYCSTNCVLTVTGSTFSNNTATNNTADTVGGAIIIRASGTHTISGSTFTNNSVTSPTSTAGGAIEFQNGTGIVNISGSVFTGNQANGSGNGGAVGASGGTLNITTSRFESNSASANGDAVYNTNGANIVLSESCITNNGDTAVFDSTFTGFIDATGGADINDSNWWGTSWGPRISAAGGGSAVSNGNSINGNGNTSAGSLVDVNLSSPGTINSAPTGFWLTTAPTVAGATCQSCDPDVSGAGYPRACY